MQVATEPIAAFQPKCMNRQHFCSHELDQGEEAIHVGVLMGKDLARGPVVHDVFQSAEIDAEHLARGAVVVSSAQPRCRRLKPELPNSIAIRGMDRTSGVECSIPIERPDNPLAVKAESCQENHGVDPVPPALHP